jgi:hypothetical protein
VIGHKTVPKSDRSSWEKLGLELRCSLMRLDGFGGCATDRGVRTTPPEQHRPAFPCSKWLGIPFNDY